ncbi:hypothetical protein G9A89_010872 [Geosiphon pyriformis]|nr:hypothetical protein G9A89_010872 [Geosiphon pyriformis]
MTSQTFLLVSDIHSRFDNIEKLHNWLISENRFDIINFIIASGDLVNTVYVTPETKPTPKDEQEYRDEIIQLAPELSMIGFGGSVDGILKEFPDQVVCPAYPSNTEQQIAEILPTLLAQVPSNDDIFLVTHFGPSETATTDVNLFPGEPQKSRIESGSPFLRNLIQSQSPSSAEPDTSHHMIAVNIHGHSHYPFGLTHIGQTMVINPGPLGDGRFAILTMEHFEREILLKRDAERNPLLKCLKNEKVWGVSSLEFFFI